MKCRLTKCRCVLLSRGGFEALSGRSEPKSCSCRQGHNRKHISGPQNDSSALNHYTILLNSLCKCSEHPVAARNLYSSLVLSGGTATVLQISLLEKAYENTFLVYNTT